MIIRFPAALACIVVLFWLFDVQLVHANHILRTKVNDTVIDNIVATIDDWRVAKRSQWMKGVESFTRSEKLQIINAAETFFNYDWPTHKAMDFLGYKITGNRTGYEAGLNKRRAVFEILVKAELVERKGRFIPQIINGLWLILEESSWVSPAHLNSQKLGLGLPHVEDSYIDLGAGKQSVDVALAYFLFKDQFDSYDKRINLRILHELHQRIIDTYLKRSDFWWMSFNDLFVNNWNIWINTNVLKTLLLVESDREKLKSGIQKIMQSADRFIDYYPEDGACDEGPSYWMHAGGELGSMLNCIQDVSNHSVSFSDQQKIKNIGSYIINAHIVDDVYTNFADAFAIQSISPNKLWNYKLVFHDANFGAFAAYLAQQNEFNPNQYSIGDLLEYSCNKEQIYAHTRAFDSPNYYYYESLGQVLFNNELSNNTLFFSAIAGHNDLSHNHNDVGSFMVYVDSKPIFIDIGVGTYTSKTFSSKRYEIWNMQSQFHNLPIINGIQQKEGKNYKASKVKASQNTKEYMYTVDIANAYSEDAAVQSWVRDFRLIKKTNTLHVTEKYTLKERKASQQIVFMTKFKPTAHTYHFELEFAESKKAILTFNTKPKAIKVEEIIIDDPRILKVWGDKMYRVIAEVDSKSKTGTIEYSLKTVN